MKRWGGLVAMWLWVCAPGMAEPALTLANNPFKRPADRLRAQSSTSRPAAEPVWQPALRGVIAAGARSLVNIDGRTVAIGESVDGYRLVAVREHEAVFRKGGQDHLIRQPLIRPRQKPTVTLKSESVADSTPSEAAGQDTTPIVSDPNAGNEPSSNKPSSASAAGATVETQNPVTVATPDPGTSASAVKSRH